MTNPVAPDSEPAPRYDDAIRFLAQRIDFERFRSIPYQTKNFQLARMRELLSRLGNPGRRLPIVHVAGTKGKGSTSAMVAAVLWASGRRTGLFTSPHLERVEQRISVDGQPCSPVELAELVEQVAPAVSVMDRAAAAQGPDAIAPTYFEITTAMALLYFDRRQVDAAVLEVGLGGRLDSTNVCRPLVSVITSISFDHTRQLGNTLEAIAREKAGIIKPGVPVVSGVTDSGPREVIRAVCRQKGARLVELGQDFDYEYAPPLHLEAGPAAGKMRFGYRAPGWEHEYRDVALSLVGRHQAANAAVALAVLAELRQAGWAIPESAVRAGLAGVVWPARVDLIARRPAIIVDAAHNTASVEALLQTLDESFSVRRRLLVFAASEDKDVPAMLSQLVNRFDEMAFTRYLSNLRAVPPEQLATLAGQLGASRFSVFARPAEAWDHVRRLAGPEDLICVTGSFFIAAEVRREIDARP